jgi:opacity protein-like surface antigen
MRFGALACGALLASCLLPSFASADSRGPGWEFGLDVIYLDSQDIDFNGGSDVALDDDFGVALVFGYRFSDRFELQFGVDWQNVDYDAHVETDSIFGQSFNARGELEAITPRVTLNYNILEGPVTPYVNAGVGWSFIDTNIPDAPPQSACWWDPWWGYVCGTLQSTRSIDELTYQAGVGLRWDISPGYTLRFAYEKHWIDLGEATSTPDLDQVKLGIVFRY